MLQVSMWATKVTKNYFRPLGYPKASTSLPKVNISDLSHHQGHHSHSTHLQTDSDSESDQRSQSISGRRSIF